jgi:hypothetical protein
LAAVRYTDIASPVQPPLPLPFLDHDANPNALYSLGITASDKGSYHGRITSVKLLLEYGTNVDPRASGDGLRYTQQRARVTWNSCSCCSATVLTRTRDRKVARLRLHLATCQEHLQVVEALLGRVSACPDRDYFQDPQMSRSKSIRWQTLSTLSKPAYCIGSSGCAGE